MSPLTPALISYWHRLPAESAATRRKSLDAMRERVRSGREPAAALVPIALGDVDEGIVASATHAYVAAAMAATRRRPRADAGREWIRRGLALNRGAVFGALLALDDEQASSGSTALRLLLSATEVEVACRVLGSSPGPHALLSCATGPTLSLTVLAPRTPALAQRSPGYAARRRREKADYRAECRRSIGSAPCRATPTCRAACAAASQSNTSECQCTRCT